MAAVEASATIPKIIKIIIAEAAERGRG